MAYDFAAAGPESARATQSASPLVSGIGLEAHQRLWRRTRAHLRDMGPELGDPASVTGRLQLVGHFNRRKWDIKIGAYR